MNLLAKTRHAVNDKICVSIAVEKSGNSHGKNEKWATAILPYNVSPIQGISRETNAAYITYIKLAKNTFMQNPLAFLNQANNFLR